MVTRSQVERLTERIDKLAEKLAPKVPERWAKIIQEVYETQEEALERHFREHPEDREANLVIYQIVDVPGRTSPGRSRPERQ